MTPSTPRPQSPPPTERVLPPPPRRLARHPERPGRRPSLSRQAIVDAAIAVLDESGVSGLSMRGVAQKLGAGVASLYGHVSGREELLELVFDELVGQVPLPTPDPACWREQVTEMLRGLRRVLMSHRDAALAGLGRVPTSPQTLAAAEVMVATLRLGGLSDRVVALGLDQLTLYVSACAFEDSLMQQSAMDPAEVRRYFEEVHAFYEALPSAHFPVLASIAPEMTSANGDERFEFGLAAMLAGLEAMSQRTDP
jgi:AcrR family transcriptional regulator